MQVKTLYKQQICGKYPSVDNAAPAKQGSPHRWQFFKAYTYDYITKLCTQQAEVIQNHENENVHNIGQGEARHRKHKRLKLGGGQAYDRSSV
jgi:hypothetical protein